MAKTATTAIVPNNPHGIIHEIAEGILIDETGIAQSALSYHMKILCESGIIESRQEGKWIYYKINEQGSSYRFLF